MSWSACTPGACTSCKLAVSARMMIACAVTWDSLFIARLAGRVCVERFPVGSLVDRQNAFLLVLAIALLVRDFFVLEHCAPPFFLGGHGGSGVVVRRAVV